MGCGAHIGWCKVGWCVRCADQLVDPLVRHVVDSGVCVAGCGACIYTTGTHLMKTQAWADIPARANLGPLLDRGEAGTAAWMCGVYRVV